jgi:hypothetical protein
MKKDSLLSKRFLTIIFDLIYEETTIANCSGFSFESMNFLLPAFKMFDLYE